MTKPALTQHVHYLVLRIEGPNLSWMGAKTFTLVDGTPTQRKEDAESLAREAAIAEPGCRFYVYASYRGFLVDEPEVQEASYDPRLA